MPGEKFWKNQKPFHVNVNRSARVATHGFRPRPLAAEEAEVESGDDGVGAVTDVEFGEDAE
jgi:hypothetical protein